MNSLDHVPNRKRRLGWQVFAALLLLGGLTACGGSKATEGAKAGPPESVAQADWDKVVEAAKKEGELKIYTSLSKTDATFKQFTAAYPEINVTVEQTPTADLISRLDQEMSVGADGADVTFHAQVSWFDEHSKNGNFAALKLSPQAQADGWDGRLQGRDFATVYSFPYFIAYNTNSGKAVSSVKEVTETEDKASIGMLDPKAATAVTFQYDLWLKTYGPDVLKRLSGHKVKVDASASTIAQALAAGELDYVVDMVPGVLDPLKAKGAPVDYVIPKEALAGPQYNVAALSTSKHSNAAQVFLNWLMSKDGESLMIKNHSPGSVPLDVEGSLPWGQVAAYKESEWPKARWDEWLTKEWTPYFK